MVLAAALLCLGLQGRLTAQPAPAAAAAPASALHAKALRLAQTVQPRERVVGQSMAILERDFLPAMLSNPDVQALEKAHPGIAYAIWEAAAPVLRQQVVATLPDLWQRLERVYSAHLDESQIDETIAFFLTPVGQKFLVEMNDKADLKPMLKEAIADPQSNIRQDTYLKTVQGAVGDAVEAMTPRERDEMGRFLTSSAGKALAAAAPDATRTGMEWMNQEEPETDAALDEAIQGAIAAYMDPERPKIASKPR